MTISEAINGYSNGKLLLDQLVCQFVSDTGGRVIYRFMVDSNHLYLRKDVIIGFGNMPTEETILGDQDVHDDFPQYIADFLSGDSAKIYDIYKRDVQIQASEILSNTFLQNHELLGRFFYRN